MNDRHWAMGFGGFMLGIVTTLVLHSVTSPPEPPKLTEEQKKEIMAQPQVELWGWQAEAVRSSEGVPRPYIVTAESDAGVKPFFPVNIQDDPAAGWKRHAIILSVWGKGDQEAIQRHLLRWADAAVGLATHDDLKR